MDGRKNDVFISVKPVGNRAACLRSPRVHESEAAAESDLARAVHLICGPGVGMVWGLCKLASHGSRLRFVEGALSPGEDREIMELHRRGRLGYL